MSKLAFSRKRAPMGGYCAPVREDASWRAGQTYEFCVCGTVKRIACRIAPAVISSYLTRPGKIGKPAASADVQLAGRRASESRLKIAPEPPCQLAACGNA